MRLGRFDAVLLAAAITTAASSSGCVPSCFIHPGSCQVHPARGQNASAGKDDDVVCTEEPVTGTNVSRLRCYKRLQGEDRGQPDRAKSDPQGERGKNPRIVTGGSPQPRLTVSTATRRARM